MTRYILQRLALLPLLMVIYSFVIFVIIQAPPGDFLTAYVATLASSGSSLSAEQIAAMRHQYGLDQPMIVQYFLWVQHLLHGDFGLSLEYQRPNAERGELKSSPMSSSCDEMRSHEATRVYWTGWRCCLAPFRSGATKQGPSYISPL